MDFFSLILILFLIAILIAPYVWLFNCSYYLREIDKKLSKLQNK